MLAEAKRDSIDVKGVSKYTEWLLGKLKVSPKVTLMQVFVNILMPSK